jgi:hypothetical protein
MQNISNSYPGTTILLVCSHLPADRTSKKPKVVNHLGLKLKLRRETENVVYEYTCESEF